MFWWVTQRDEVYLSAGPPGRTHVITTGRDLFLSSCAPPSKENNTASKHFHYCHLKTSLRICQRRSCSTFVDVCREMGKIYFWLTIANGLKDLTSCRVYFGITICSPLDKHTVAISWYIKHLATGMAREKLITTSGELV